MIEKKDLLISYLSWILCFLICMIVGIVNTYALTFTNFQYVQNSTQLLVEYRTGSQPIDWPYNNSGLYQTDIVRLNYIVSNVSIAANVHYEFESHMLSQRIIGTPTYTVSGLNGESCLTDSYYLNFINSEYPRWDFQCPHATSTFTLTIYQPNNSNLFNSGTMGWGSAILSQTNEPISSTNNDTEEIINNQNKNTNDIINNQNENTDKINETIDNNLNTCVDEHFEHPIFIQVRLIVGGQISGNNATDSAGYLNVENYQGKYVGIKFENLDSNHSPRANYCFTSQLFTNTTINCIDYVIRPNAYTSQEYLVQVPNNAKYLYVLGYLNYIDENWVNNNISIGVPKVCKNKIDSITDNLNDDDSSGATNEADDFFSNFSTNTFGLTSIITAPLTLIQSIASQSCSSLHLPLPYLNNKYLDLPCMSTIYSTYFGTFFTLYQTITYGIIAYWVCVRIFNQVKDFKNPEHDEIEVLDL